MFVHFEIYDLFKKGISIDHVVEKYEKFLNNLHEYKNKKNESNDLDKNLMKFYNPFSKESFDLFINLLREWEYFSKIYENEETLTNENFKNELFDFFIFTNNIYASSKLLFPALMGCQFGCNDITKKLLEKSLEIVNREL